MARKLFIAWLCLVSFAGSAAPAVETTTCEADHAKVGRARAHQAVFNRHFPSAVQEILRWVGEHGHPDVPIVNIAPETHATVPVLSRPRDIRTAFHALESAYDKLLLTTAYPAAFDKVPTLQRDLARQILKQHFDSPPARLEGAQAFEEVMGALSALHVSGTSDDLRLLQPAGKWAQWLPNTFAELRAKLGSKPRGKANAQEIREWVEAVFKDVEADGNIPEFKFHSDHSRRVSALAIKLLEAYRKSKDLPPLTPKEIEAYETAGFVHDFGKIYWTRDLIAKRSRLSASEKDDLLKAIRTADNLTPAEIAQAVEAVETLCEPVTAEKPLVQYNPAQSILLSRLVKQGVMTPETRQLLQSEEIIPSTAERAGFDTHYGGSRVLGIFDPGGISAKTAQLHHEALNGSGYPFHLDAATIGGSAEDVTWIRALSVADVYDAMTEPRPNSPVGKTPAVALKILSGSKDKLDAEFIDQLSGLVPAE